MTAIAFRDGVLASDSCVTENGVNTGTARKIVRVRGGGLAAASGAIKDVALFLDWASGGFKPEDAPDIDDACGMRIKRNGSVWFYDDETDKTYRIDAPFHAIGSGSIAALAAMHAGASAIEAVEVACKLVQGCAPPVVSLSMKSA